ncbi:MAG TPA: DUF6178 family protein [Gemmatimonadaceae bacterium]|nr:DUF6178 family protein [Gemmatimonadaceae bacterium]
MSTTTNRLARLLDTPFLARVVPHLAPETLHQLIQYRGLDACGELVTAATPAQLTSLLDLDLWKHAQPGCDEQFDVERFGEWLEVLVDTGDAVAARTVAALDKDLVIAGLSRYLRVFDPGTFEPTESSDDEAIDRHERMNSETSSNVPECEVGGYLVRARRTDAWDAIVTLLTALEGDQSHYFHAVMQGCRRLSNSTPEIDGLDDLLLAPEQHIHDVTIERDRRRSQHGYAPAADARAFLQMARQPRTEPTSIPINPIAAAYFRALDEEPDGAQGPAPANATESAPGASERGDEDIPESISAVVELLAEAGMMPVRPRALLEAASDDPRAAKLPLLRRLLEFVLQHDESAYLTRNRELAFLANTLFAGCAVQSRPFTPQEASDAAACICNLGLECWPTGTPPDTFLVNHGLVEAFEVGWSVLYRDVSLFVTDQLVSALADLECADAGIRRELHRLRRTLVKQRAAGTPWLARPAADVLAMLDMTAWISVLGLLDECPILPAALTAVLERRTTSVSQTAFEFISTTAQIGDVRVFMKALPGLLSS